MADHAPTSRAAAAIDTSEHYANALDQRDALRGFRERFAIPTIGDVAGTARTVDGAERGAESIYLCGNSLGLMPKGVKDAVNEDLDAWSRLGVEGHLHARRPWLPAHEFVRRDLATLVGALEREVVAMNSLTVNLHLMMASFYRPTQTRHKILIEDSAFPSDSYAVQSQAAFHGLDPRQAVVRVAARAGTSEIRTEDVVREIERHRDSLALVLLGGVNYLTGQVMDFEAITRAGRAAGAMVGWDLAHAAGNIALRLHDWGPDFACWCSYKYLNSGPGAVAGCFVHERHLGRTGTFGSADFLPRLAGWWGNDPATRFRMGPDFVPVASADAWAVSNPPILALTPLRVSLGVFAEAGMEALCAKSREMTGYLRSQISAIPGADRMVEVVTPGREGAFGCQLSLAVRERPREFLAALTARGVACDFREPNVVRIAPVPLYNSFHDCWRFARVLATHLGAGGA